MLGFFTSESTGRAHANIDDILRSNMEATHLERLAREGTIGSTPWEATDEGKQQILDMVTGSASSAPLQLIRKGVGRLATNLAAPRNYSVKDKFKNLLKYIKEHGMKKTLKKVAKDEPILDLRRGGKVVDQDRELPFRLMFDLKPRYSAAYKKIPKSYETGGSPFNIVRQVEFNPKTVAGQTQLEFVRKGATPEYIGYRPGAPAHHPVMGGYKRGLQTREGNIDYEDLWDLGLNKGETRRLYERFKHKSQEGQMGIQDAQDEVGSYILRKLAESITNPVLIKGTAKPLAKRKASFLLDELF